MRTRAALLLLLFIALGDSAVTLSFAHRIYHKRAYNTHSNRISDAKLSFECSPPPLPSSQATIRRKEMDPLRSETFPHYRTLLIYVRMSAACYAQEARACKMSCDHTLAHPPPLLSAACTQTKSQMESSVKCAWMSVCVCVARIRSAVRKKLDASRAKSARVLFSAYCRLL